MFMGFPRTRRDECISIPFGIPHQLSQDAVGQLFQLRAPTGTVSWNLKSRGSHADRNFTGRGFPGSCLTLTWSLVLLPLFYKVGELEATGTHDGELLMSKLQFLNTNHQLLLFYTLLQLTLEQRGFELWGSTCGCRWGLSNKYGTAL